MSHGPITVTLSVFQSLSLDRRILHRPLPCGRFYALGVACALCPQRFSRSQTALPGRSSPFPLFTDERDAGPYRTLTIRLNSICGRAAPAPPIAAARFPIFSRRDRGPQTLCKRIWVRLPYFEHRPTRSFGTICVSTRLCDPSLPEPAAKCVSIHLQCPSGHIPTVSHSVGYELLVPAAVTSKRAASI